MLTHFTPRVLIVHLYLFDNRQGRQVDHKNEHAIIHHPRHNHHD